MIPEDRLKKILTIVNRNQSVSVSELEAQLYVSSATIRRDLSELARRGLIVRSFGGAMAATSVGNTAPAISSSESTPLGRAAAQLVKDRETIFLTASPLTLSMAAELTQRTGLTVVTDSLKISNKLCGKVSRLYCTGGRYLLSQGLFVGQQAAELAGQFRFDSCFIACDGLTGNGFLTYAGVERLPVLDAVMLCARRRILLCKGEQIGASATNALLELRSFDTVVTDAPYMLPAVYKGLVIEPEKEAKRGKRE
ncbi:MAG: DeoR/GlpR transcriptional regulator [Oscillospiraceae bacterium]|nr:DeoR/GlpR transcriptional regulator [Oscillospiraceae bacterium]